MMTASCRRQTDYLQPEMPQIHAKERGARGDLQEPRPKAALLPTGSPHRPQPWPSCNLGSQLPNCRCGEEGAAPPQAVGARAQASDPVSSSLHWVWPMALGVGPQELGYRGGNLETYKQETLWVHAGPHPAS